MEGRESPPLFIERKRGQREEPVKAETLYVTFVGEVEQVRLNVIGEQ
jgi:hypothetical protein